jgi:1-acyl-sn-glycerol-3-phosphate acyltransferase
LESLTAALIIGGLQFLTNPRTRWLGCRPDAAARIYYSNHTSHLDFVLLWSALPRRPRAQTRPVASVDYWERTIVRRYMIQRVFRGLLVKRGQAGRETSLARMLEALARQESLIVFPEGTRGSGGELGSFRCGLFHLAQARPEVDLIPVWIGNSSRVLPRGSFLPLPLMCSVTFGEPLHIVAGEEKASFLDRLRRSLLALEAQ